MIGAALLAVGDRRRGRSSPCAGRSIEVERWIRPSVLTAGDVGRVEVLVEPVGRVHVAGVRAGRAGRRRTARPAWRSPRSSADTDVSAGYRIPTERRGVLTIGPLVAVRQDVLGLARSTTEVAGVEEVLVSPRAHLLDMPLLGQGVLGRHLLALAQRLGPGDFHSLRDYVDGDEPRTIHWRASARSEKLKVRQHSVEGLQRCVVLLDQHVADGAGGDEAFERAVTVGRQRRAQRRPGRADDPLRHHRRRRPARARRRRPDAAPAGPHRASAPRPTVPVERDPSEGLGLVVSIGADPWVDVVGRARPHRRSGADADRRVHRWTSRHRVAAARRRRPVARARSCASWAAPGRRRRERRAPRATRGRRDPILSEVGAVTATAAHRGAAGADGRRARDRRDGLDVAATLALAPYSFVAALGFARVFADWQFVARRRSSIVHRRPRHVVR